MDSKATVRAVVQGDLDLLALAVGRRPAPGRRRARRRPPTYKQRVRTAPLKYAGRMLRTGREARDLLANPAIQIVKSAGLTCVADPYRALCRIRTDQGGGRFTLDVSDCRPVP